jgi:hypothetical protein
MPIWAIQRILESMQPELLSFLDIPPKKSACGKSTRLSGLGVTRAVAEPVQVRNASTLAEGVALGAR